MRFEGLKYLFTVSINALNVQPSNQQLVQTMFQRQYSYFVNKMKSMSDQEEFEDTKGTIRNRISKKNRQHNGQHKKYKRTLKIE